MDNFQLLCVYTSFHLCEDKRAGWQECFRTYSHNYPTRAPNSREGFLRMPLKNRRVYGVRKAYGLSYHIKFNEVWPTKSLRVEMGLCQPDQHLDLRMMILGVLLCPQTNKCAPIHFNFQLIISLVYYFNYFPISLPINYPITITIFSLQLLSLATLHSNSHNELITSNVSVHSLHTTYINTLRLCCPSYRTLREHIRN